MCLKDTISLNALETFGTCDKRVSNGLYDCCMMDAPCFTECKEDNKCRYRDDVLAKQGKQFSI